MDVQVITSGCKFMWMYWKKFVIWYTDAPNHTEFNDYARLSCSFILMFWSQYFGNVSSWNTTGVKSADERDLCETGHDGLSNQPEATWEYVFPADLHTRVFLCVDCGAGECFDDFRSHTHFSLDLQWLEMKRERRVTSVTRVTVGIVWCRRAAPSESGCATAARIRGREWRCTGASERGPCRRRRSTGPRSGWSGRSTSRTPGALRTPRTAHATPARERRSCSVAG